MHLRRIAIIVTFLVAAVIIVVIAGVAFMGLFGRDDPTKDDPAAYTKAFVQKAIERYERDGRQATIDYYNDPGNIDGQWDGVIVDEDGYTIAHHNPERRGMDPDERVDATGYFFGDDVMAATGEGHWVEYILLNPATGQNQKKHAWVVRHEGLIFGSGWYEE